MYLYQDVLGWKITALISITKAVSDELAAHRYAAWSTLAFSELQLWAAKPLRLLPRAASLSSWIELRSQLLAICHIGQSGQVINLLAWRCSSFSLPSAASGPCAVVQISPPKRQCSKQVWKQHNSPTYVNLLMWTSFNKAYFLIPFWYRKMINMKVLLLNHCQILHTALTIQERASRICNTNIKGALDKYTIIAAFSQKVGILHH